MKIFTKPPKSGHLRVAENFDQTSGCPLFRSLAVVTKRVFDDDYYWVVLIFSSSITSSKNKSLLKHGRASNTNEE